MCSDRPGCIGVAFGLVSPLEETPMLVTREQLLDMAETAYQFDDSTGETPADYRKWIAKSGYLAFIIGHTQTLVPDPDKPNTYSVETRPILAYRKTQPSTTMYLEHSRREVERTEDTRTMAYTYCYWGNDGHDTGEVMQWSIRVVERVSGFEEVGRVMLDFTGDGWEILQVEP